MAGVVNFIIDTDFEGIRIDGQYSGYQHNNRNKIMPPLLDARIAQGLTGYDYPKGSVWDGGTIDVTAALGTKLGDRGHAMVYFGYRKVKPILQRNDWASLRVAVSDLAQQFITTFPGGTGPALDAALRELRLEGKVMLLPPWEELGEQTAAGAIISATTSATRPACSPITRSMMRSSRISSLCSWTTRRPARSLRRVTSAIR